MSIEVEASSEVEVLFVLDASVTEPDPDSGVFDVGYEDLGVTCVYILGTCFRVSDKFLSQDLINYLEKNFSQEVLDRARE